MNWYIGQPVVAIRNHSNGLFKKGQEFTIKGLRKSPCEKCNNTDIDVGFQGYSNYYCNEHRFFGQPNNGIYWLDERNFAPLDVNIEELTNILEQPLEVANVLQRFAKEEQDYETCNRLLAELNSIGYTCDYDLGGIPCNIKPINHK